MTLYDRVAGLPLSVEEYGLRRRERETSGGFTRVTTTFALTGDGATGRGEDVTYDEADHDALAAAPPDLPTGEYTFGEYADALDDVDLFAEPPARETARHYRRWAVESAALDLALRQADRSLGDALERSYDPVRFVASTRIGEEGFARIEELTDANPDLAFKLDPEPEWSDELLDALADSGRVRVLDFKAFYEDEEVGTPVDAAFYRRIAERLPDAVLEDARATDGTRDLLAAEQDRLSWDYPITGVESIRELPFEPRWLNVKPSRFGTVEALLDALEHCERQGIQLYGGGQYELGVGRGHIQAVASLFYPDGPNDVAPREYNDPGAAESLPRSPIEPPEEIRGIGWD